MKNIEIPDVLFTSDEYSEAKKSVIEGKTLGSDDFALEVLKYCDFDNIILGYVNKLLVGKKLDQWSESDMKALPKSGNLSLMGNYRGVE